MPTKKKSPAQLEREIEESLASRKMPMKDRLFSGTFPTGISYADRAREKHGDYMRLAFLPFRTLELEWSKGVTIPAELRAMIERDAERLQKRRGELYQVSTSGQTVLLGESAKRHHSTRAPAKTDRRKIRYVQLAWSNPPGYSRPYVEGNFPETEVTTILEGLFQSRVPSVNVEDRDFALTSLDAVYAAAKHAQDSLARRRR